MQLLFSCVSHTNKYCTCIIVRILNWDRANIDKMATTNTRNIRKKNSSNPQSSKHGFWGILVGEVFSPYRKNPQTSNPHSKSSNRNSPNPISRYRGISGHVWLSSISRIVKQEFKKTRGLGSKKSEEFWKNRCFEEFFFCMFRMLLAWSFITVGFPVTVKFFSTSYFCLMPFVF